MDADLIEGELNAQEFRRLRRDAATADTSQDLAVRPCEQFSRQSDRGRRAPQRHQGCIHQGDGHPRLNREQPQQPRVRRQPIRSVARERAHRLHRCEAQTTMETAHGIDRTICAGKLAKPMGWFCRTFTRCLRRYTDAYGIQDLMFVQDKIVEVSWREVEHLEPAPYPSTQNSRRSGICSLPKRWSVSVEAGAFSGEDSIA